MIHAPRVIGDVLDPFAVTLRTLPCVMNPPRTLSAGDRVIVSGHTNLTDGKPVEVRS